MAKRNWPVLNNLKKAVKKIRFLLSFDIKKWRLAAFFLRNSSVRTRYSRLSYSFNDRLGLHGCIDQDSDLSTGNSPAQMFRRSSSYAYGSDEDIDKRAEIFIANFRRQLLLEKQVSLNLRYYRGSSSGSDVT